MNRAHARRRLAAWDRYERRYPQAAVRSTSGAHRWWKRAHRHRTTHQGIKAHGGAR